MSGALLAVRSHAVPSLRAVAARPRSFVVAGDAFVRDGEPFVLRSGSIHYARVPIRRILNLVGFHWRGERRGGPDAD